MHIPAYYPLTKELRAELQAEVLTTFAATEEEPQGRE